jgi:hypothetical protein
LFENVLLLLYAQALMLFLLPKLHMCLGSHVACTLFTSTMSCGSNLSLLRCSIPQLCIRLLKGLEIQPGVVASAVAQGSNDGLGIVSLADFGPQLVELGVLFLLKLLHLNMLLETKHGTNTLLILSIMVQAVRGRRARPQPREPQVLRLQPHHQVSINP